ncbi:hypothetical protein E1B25_21170 [Antarcticimicrobium sediminis]|uniref:Uncharacterized protein n=1 Tax=Antarcticimicrobium sediminis TaxID=2546227 RepID=A0A4R5EGI1_9RHOB|nr:hypothetical protein E1B25_21170 [Antarcticimicrobium sediminis]
MAGHFYAGGYAHVADKIRELRERDHDLPAHSAARRRCMQQAVVCAVILNKPPPTFENGGAKLDHGSGGIVLLRAE